MTVKIDKRFSKRFQYAAAYTLSRIQSTSPDGLGLGGNANGSAVICPLVNRNVQANYGISALDRTNPLGLNGIVELPLGFRATLISTVYRGVSHARPLRLRAISP